MDFWDSAGRPEEERQMQTRGRGATNRGSGKVSTYPGLSNYLVFRLFWASPGKTDTLKWGR